MVKAGTEGISRKNNSYILVSVWNIIKWSVFSFYPCKFNILCYIYKDDKAEY